MKECQSLLQNAEFIRKSIQNLNQYFEKNIQKSVEQTGFTVPQMRVIEQVVDHKGISIKEISQNLPMTQSTVSGIVERLIHKGILMKKTNTSDKRAVQIFPTEAVYQFLEKDRIQYVNQSVLGVLNRLSQDEQAVVIKGLCLLVDAVEGLKGE